MSTQDEDVVRDFLLSKGYDRTSWPYDWLDLDPEMIDDGTTILPIPDEVFDAYHRTRRNFEDRARDSHLYAQHFFEAELLMGVFPWAWLTEDLDAREEDLAADPDPQLVAERSRDLLQRCALQPGSPISKFLPK